MDPEAEEAPFTVAVLKETLFNEETGYVSHPALTSGPYTLTAYDEESGQVERVQKDTEEILFLAKYTVASRSASWHNRRKRHEPCQIVET